MECGAIDSNGTHRQAMHGHGHKAENMLYTTTNLGLSAGILFASTIPDSVNESLNNQIVLTSRTFPPKDEHRDHRKLILPVI